VALSTVFTAYQALITKRQLDAALSQQRPWIRLQAEPINGVKFDASGADVPMRLTMTNVGPVPAIGVRTATGMATFSPPSGQALQYISSEELAQAEYPVPYAGLDCDDDIGAHAGVVVFPGETVSLAANVHLDREVVDLTRSDRLLVSIRACVVYYAGVGSDHHHTQRALIISRKLSPANKDPTFRSQADEADATQIHVVDPPWGNEVH
jgi:hypothetical protein